MTYLITISLMQNRKPGATLLFNDKLVQGWILRKIQRGLLSFNFPALLIIDLLQHKTSIFLILLFCFGKLNKSKIQIVVNRIVFQ